MQWNYHPNYRLGDNFDPNFAFAVSTGDINGDSFVDLVLPAGGEDHRGGRSNSNEGSVYVIDGLSQTFYRRLTIEPRSPEDLAISFTGWGVTSGDFNGDGYGDVAANFEADPINAFGTRVWFGPDLGSRSLEPAAPGGGCPGWFGALR